MNKRRQREDRILVAEVLLITWEFLSCLAAKLPLRKFIKTEHSELSSTFLGTLSNFFDVSFYAFTRNCRIFTLLFSK
jgi:hypothetical protein